MQMWEVQQAYNGIRRRIRPHWETTRWLGWIVSRIMGGKIETPEDMSQFPWEIEYIDPDELAKQTEELLAQCRAENAAIDAKSKEQKEAATK